MLKWLHHFRAKFKENLFKFFDQDQGWKMKDRIEKSNENRWPFQNPIKKYTLVVILLKL